MVQDLKRELLKRRELLEQIIKEKKKHLDAVPEGSLRYCKNGNRIQYYHRTDPRDICGKYIRKKDRKLAEDLAQKDYDSRILKLAEQEIQEVEKLLNLYENHQIENIYESLSEPRRDLIIPIIEPDELYANKWQAEVYEKKRIREDMPDYYTAKGERVCSKTEIIIADTLNRLGVPYHYEKPLYLQGAGIIHPDFTVLNIKTRKEYYWEHMGMMDNIGYLDNALERINLYEQNGYYPGEQLLITHETSIRPIRTRKIEELAKRYLL